MLRYYLVEILYSSHQIKWEGCALQKLYCYDSQIALLHGAEEESKAIKSHGTEIYVQISESFLEMASEEKCRNLANSNYEPYKSENCNTSSRFPHQN